MKRTSFLLLAALLGCAFAAHAQTTTPFELKIGYRWLDLKGSSNMYRTQINERNGVSLRLFSMSGVTPGLERYRIEANDLGIGPAGALRIDATRDGVYKFRFAYRTADAFSIYPTIAEGQHVVDRRRRMIDGDIEFLTNSAISPFFGWSMNENRGPGSTTVHLGQDEFRLGQNIVEHDRELRAGASFHFSSIYGQLTQGWRNYRSTESLSLEALANAGNNLDPILGTPITADAITRTDKTHVKTPYTNFFITGDFLNRVRVVGNYVHLAADGDGSESESATGSFVSFAVNRFFSGFTSSGTSTANNDTWRAGGRVEVNLLPNVDADAGFQRERRNLNGAALVNDFFLQSITFGGADKKDLLTVLNARSSIDRNEDVTHVAVSAHAIGPFSARAEYRESKFDVTVDPDLSEIVVPGNQSGDFNRRVHTLDLSGAYTAHGLTVGASWRKDSANDPIFHTDFLDRDRTRLRATWSSPQQMFRAGATWERTNQDNDNPDTGYDANMRQYGADFEVAPIAALRLRASVSQYKTDSIVSIRIPQNFTISQSAHREDGKSREGGVNYVRGPFSVDGSLARFANKGSLPFDIDRYRLRVTYDFKSKMGIAGEWDRDTYDESSTSFSDYQATRYGLFFRWRP